MIAYGGSLTLLFELLLYGSYPVANTARYRCKLRVRVWEMNSPYHCTSVYMNVIRANVLSAIRQNKFITAGVKVFFCH